MDSDDTTGRHDAPLGRCANCSAPLASDQRYCVSCGTRRGPLPASIDSRLRELRAVPPSTAAGAAAPSEDEPSSRWSLPTARVASLVVMAMLSFGVIAGSLATPGGAASLAHTLVVAVMPPPTPTVTSPVSDGGGGGSGGGSPAAITETITETAPSSPAASSSAGASSGSSSTAGAGASSGAGSGSAAVSLPPIKHVFLIMLSGQGYNESFGMTTGHHYLSSTLRKTGELLNNYYGVAQSSLASEIALISGQGPTVDTEADCPVFTDVAATSDRAGSQVLGNGCVYPQTTPTLAGELTDNGNTWKAYIQGIDQGPAGQPRSCRYPSAGAADPNQAASPTDPYVTWLNPFVYFQSLTTGTECAQDDVGLDDLGKDLKQAKTTPNLSYIAPDTCDDGSDTPCRPGATAGLARSDAFLKTVVPEIEASPAYKQDGMIVITFDQAPQSGPDADTTSCCDQPTFPNLSGETGTTTAGATTTTGTTTGSTTTGSTTTSTTTTGTATTDTSVTPAPGTTTTATTTTAAAPPTTDSTTLAGTDTTTSTGTTSSTVATTPTTTTAPTTCPTSGTTTTGTTTTSGSGTATTGCTNADGTPLGGGQVGALLISRYIKPGSEDATGTFNHFSLLKTIEGLFSVKQLGYSKDTSLPEFDASVFNAYSGS